MANFKLDRFKYNWRGAWSENQQYFLDDVVGIGGSSYICIQQHTSSNLFGDDLFNFDSVNNIPNPFWIKMTDGNAWKDLWTPGGRYEVGDIVRSGGNVWICVEPHIGQIVLADDLEKWAVYAESIGWTEEWLPETGYDINHLVRYNGIVYRCITGHVSGTLEEGLVKDLDTENVEQSKWTIYYENIKYRGNYSTGKIYRKNDLVTYNGTLLRCIEEHQSTLINDSTTQSEIDSDKWQIELFGEEFQGEWNEETFYGVGSIVRHGGYLYYSITDNFGSIPTLSIINDSSSQFQDWIILSKGIRFRGTWNEAESYLTGDVVRKGGNLFVALVDTELFRDTGDSTLDFLDETKWEILTESLEWQGVWKLNNFYPAGTLVFYRGTAWKSKFNHISTNQNFPGFTISGFDFWEIVAESGPNVGLTNKGELLTLGFPNELAGETNTVGPTGVALSNTAGDLLQVAENFKINYNNNWGKVERRVFVAPIGIDSVEDPEQGFVYYKPWKTISFAIEQIDDGFEGNTTVDVATGTFSEILPLVVPARTAIVGSELRSTTIKPNEPIAEMQDDINFQIDAVNRLSNILTPLIQGNFENIVKTPTNNLEPVLITENNQPIPTSFNSITKIQTLIIDYINYISFFILEGGSLPEIIGSNQEITDVDVQNTARVLEENKKFIVQELISFIEFNNPERNFDKQRFERGITQLINAFKFDIIFEGNYKTIKAAKFYKNQVLGSKNEDMFYMHDSSGARNFTAIGLEGEKPIPTAQNPFSIPSTAPAFFSLDPSWGPEDETVWIKNRSPYLQNITNLGTGAIGKKVDGFLHNGGNRSMVSNDFTQVISDGIGAWVLNVGRAELVSVFTYYCNIGYLTTDGGIIRSTNGNNSYGNFGSVSIGVDQTEIPAEAKINTRLNDAQISSIFTGQFADELQIVEWTNAGSNYTEASGVITGAGAEAEIDFNDFRDRAISNIDLLDVADPEDLAVDIGGSGFKIIRNTASFTEVEGDALQEIVLAAGETATSQDIVGMRIVITSGAGTGQYAIIDSYDSSSKTVTVRKESDGELGWDHLIPGAELALSFDTGTNYSIEPRVIFSSPSTSLEEKLLPDNGNWSAGSFGYFVKIFTIETSITGSLVGQVTTPATVTITAEKRKYSTISIVDGGTGYKVLDEIVISGNQLEGTSPANNAVVTVQEVDENGSIISALVQGIPNNDRFVVIERNSNNVIFSNNLETWSQSNLPIIGNWEILIYGNESFLAVTTGGSDVAAVSSDGENWTQTQMPEEVSWVSGIFGNENFVVISSPENSNPGFAAISANGETWNRFLLPTNDNYIDITFGKRKYVILSETNNQVAFSEDAINWTNVTIDSGSSKNWKSIAYGNNRFIALSEQGEIRLSLNLEDWNEYSIPIFDSTVLRWDNIQYNQGIFIATSKNLNFDQSDVIATSSDGIIWQFDNLTKQEIIGPIIPGTVFAENQYTPVFSVIFQGTNSSNILGKGVTAKGRVRIRESSIGSITLWDTGSNYKTLPTMQIIDPNATEQPEFRIKINDGVLSNPDWINRGFGYRVATTRINVTGDGFADIVPIGNNINVSNLKLLPAVGSQLLIDNIDTLYTVSIADEIIDPNNAGISARLRISPPLRVRDDIEHNREVVLRRRFSQNRISGHDFLDVGTGNFDETNYPQLYFEGLVDGLPENEVRETSGGKTFYTSTDQSGNFRVGDLFEVEQATGIITVSAEFFDFTGLSELRLGGIRIGGSGVVIREFSTDPTLSADSNNVASTQRAIARFIQSRLTVGGSSIEVPNIVAGQIDFGPDQISNSLDLTINFEQIGDFNGPKSGIKGVMLAKTIFTSSFLDVPGED